MSDKSQTPFSKADLIEGLIAKSDGQVATKAAAGRLIDLTFELLAGGLKKNGAAVIPSFGAFTVKQRPARKGRNPATGEQIKIAASKSVGFKMRGELKQTIAPVKKPKKA